MTAIPAALPVRLSPNALPPATMGRFFLLIATALAGSAYIYGWLASRIWAVGDLSAVCARMAQGASPKLAPDALVAWYAGCSRWASLRSALVIALMIGAFAAVTIAIYLVRPHFLRRGLTPAERTVGQDAALVVLTDMVARYGGGRRIRLWVDLGGPSRAFGHVGAYHLVVSISDLHLLQGQAPARGVVLHELAHIRNRDVDLTQLAIAVWWGYLLAVLLPFGAIAYNAPGLLIDFGWRAVVMLALLWLVRGGVLRMREYYADAAAAAGSPADEEAIVSYLDRPPTRGWYARLYHPSRRTRQASLRTGRALFRLDVAVAGATGLLVGIAYTPAYYLLSLALPDRTYLRGWLTGVIFGLLVAAVLGGSVWRATLWSMAHGAPAKEPGSNLLAVGGFTAGLLAGQLVTPAILTVGSWGAVLTVAPAYAVAPAVLLFVGAYLGLLWSRTTARTWLSVSGAPRWAYRFGVAGAAVVFGVFLAAWFQLVELSSTGQGWAILGLFAVSVVVNPAVIAALVWGFGYAVAAWQTRRMAYRRSGYAFWRFGVRAPLPAEAPTGLGGVYAVAAGAVLAYSAMEPLYYASLRQHMVSANGAGAGGTDDLLAIIGFLFGPAVFVAVAAAFVVGFLTGGRGRLGHAACSAGLGLMLMAALLFGAALVHLNVAYPDAIDPATLLRGLSGVPVLGQVPEDAPDPALGLMVCALFALMLLPGLIAAGVGSVARAWVSGWRRTRPLRWWVAAIEAVPLVVLAIVLIGLTATEADVRVSLSLPAAVDRDEIDAILDRAEPGTLTREQACAGVYAEFADRGLASTTASGQLDSHLATAARLAVSAQDSTLYTIGRSIKDADRLAEVQRAARGVAVALEYCAATGAVAASGA